MMANLKQRDSWWMANCGTRIKKRPSRLHLQKRINLQLPHL